MDNHIHTQTTFIKNLVRYETQKYVIIACIVFILSSCSINTTETTTISTVSIVNTEQFTGNTTFQNSTTILTSGPTTDSMTTNPTTTQTETVDPLQDAICINDVFYYNENKETVYLVIDDEIKDSYENIQSDVTDNYFISSIIPVYREIPVVLKIPPHFEYDGRLFTAVNNKISEVKFMAFYIIKLFRQNMNYHVPLKEENLIKVS